MTSLYFAPLDDLRHLVHCFSQVPLRGGKVGGAGGGVSPSFGSSGTCEILASSRVVEIISLQKDAILIVS